MEGELISRRSVLESQDPASLFLLREQLHNKVALAIGDIALVTEVLDGYGYSRYDPGYAYDASQDEHITNQHSEDDQWVVRGTE